ncbi:PKD domain-containing protein [Winogradskyella sp. UBA3174]|uniref:PKD domain-containing protein n=1 Tax=Winogradskyella sp. UBA3174 TaxID=1947785 RepID=UPI0025F6F7C4|nr:PKD domain-containing protein [Winogradskyella sp. UBA3174]|tara:strand:+ start:17025 stop:17789 length:765 start_codon:yes stop_codon:yes gene_type:complete
MKKVIQIISVLCIAIVFAGCTDDDDVVPQAVTANFTQTINQNTGEVIFLNTSTGANSYAWDFGDGTSSSVINPIKSYVLGGMYSVVLQVSNDGGSSDSFEDLLVIDEQFNGGLLTNGDFENGNNSWIQGVDDNNPAPVVTVDGNIFYQVNVTNPNPGQPFLVNVSQKLEITQGVTYTLTFDAWSDQDRDIIAGIGLSGGDFSNTVQTVSINTTQQQYQLTVEATGFGAPDARVLFDSNGQAGLVNIDNVSLTAQ